MAEATGGNKNLKNQIANNPQNESFQAVLTTELSKSFKAIKSLVPKHVTPERMIRVGLNAVSRNPKLLECTPASIVGSIVNCATLGLEPNLIGHAYLVPFYNSKTKQMEAQFQIGYKGAIELFRRTGEVSNITAHEVHVNDIFEVTYGTDEKIVHKPTPWDKESGEVIGYYSTYKLKDGSYGFCVMSKKEVERHRDDYTKSKKNGQVFGPWKDQFDEMAKKTCILKMAKYMPISIEKQENQTIMDGMNRDGGVINVKETNVGFGDAFMDVHYSVVGDDEEPEEGDNSSENPEPSASNQNGFGDDFEAAMNGQM